MTAAGTPAEDARSVEARRRRTDPRPGVVRIAAVGDFHCGVEDVGKYREHFARVNEEADVLLLAGDLTRRGTPPEIRVVLGELADVRIPILAVLGNHDHESGRVEEAKALLRENDRIHLLGSEPFELNEHVGIAGVKGFMGGFGRWTLTAFGEAATKEFVGTTIEEAQTLEFALRRLPTPIRVVLLHYSPTVDTVMGEPETIHAFLGNDRLAEPIDRFGATVVFHGHAHHGTFSGKTAGGVPVYNVSLSLIRQEGVGEMYYVYEIPIPPDAEREPPATMEPAPATSGAPESA
jgi:Icc-related predicted phosphoesterase